VTRRLARTDPTKRAVDVLAYFDRPGTSNGPTEAINGRLEHLRGSALGFRNLTSYIARPYSKPAASDLSYTLECDEPEYRTIRISALHQYFRTADPARCPLRPSWTPMGPCAMQERP
jgi:hypothetical protein